MKVKDYLNEVAYIGKSEIEDDDEEIYYSKFDDSYITRVGMEDSIDHLAKNEITEELTHGVGFSPKDQKWYGWSHRAMYGFEIGSTCEKGDCHYSAKDKDDFLESMINFWKDGEYRRTTTGVHDRNEIMYSEPVNPGDPEQKSVPSGKFEEGVTISFEYDNAVPNEKLRGTISSCFQVYPEKWGKGEWVAKTLEDAKQMAKDFNRGVS
jgi:hypothetical protein